jgi:hypothetical protein
LAANNPSIESYGRTGAKDVFYFMVGSWEKNQFPQVILTLLCLEFHHRLWSDIVNLKNIVILANSTEIQAVQSKSLNISEVVFYQPGKINLGNNLILISDSPCILMIKLNGKTIDEIAVSDPTEKIEFASAYL